MSLLDTVVSVGTVGQCNTGGCGGGHRDTQLGDALANTATFGQCNGSGCGSGHSGTWSPVQAGLGTMQSVLSGQLPSPQQQQQMLQLVAAYMLLSLLLEII